MPLGTREVLLVIRAKDQASRIVTGIGASFGHLEGDAAKAAKRTAGIGSALLGAGVAIAAIGALGLKWLNGATQAAMDYNKTAALTLTQADKTKVSFAQVRDIGLQVARDFPVAFDSVQKAFYDIFSSIDVNVPQAKALLNGFARAATAGNADIQVAGRATIAILNAYHLPVSDLNKVLDLQFQLVRKGVGTYEEFATTIGRAIPSSVRAGQSFSTLAAMLAFLTRNGLSTSMAAASAARALDAMSHPTVALRLQKMGISVRDANGQFRPLVDTLGEMNKKFGAMTQPDRAKALQELFKGAGGTIQARRFFDTVFHDFAGFKTRIADMAHSGGSMMAAFGTMMDQPANKALILQNRFKALKIQIGEELIPAKVKLMEIITKILGWWNKLSPSVQKLIIKGVALTFVLMTIVGIFMAVVGAAMLLDAMLAFLGIGFGALAIGAGVVILVIAAIVIIVILCIKYHKQIAEVAKATWHYIQDAVMHAWNDYILPVFQTLVRFVMQTIPHAFWALVDTVKAAWHIIQDSILTAWNAIANAAKIAWHKVQDVIMIAWNAIYPILVSIGVWIETYVVPVFIALGELAAAIWMRITQAFDVGSQMVSFYMNILTDVISFAWDKVKLVFDVTMTNLKHFWSMFTTDVSIVWHHFTNVAQMAMIIWKVTWNTIWIILQGVFGGIKVAFILFSKTISIIWRPLWNMVWATVKLVFNLLKTIVEAGLMVIKGIIEVITGIITGKWSKVWQGIQDIFSGAWHLMANTVAVIWEFIKQIIVNGITGVKNFVTQMPEVIARACGDWSKKLYNLGIQFIQGLIDGMGSLAQKAIGTVVDLGKNLVKAGLKAFGIGSPSRITIFWGKMLGQGLIEGMLGSKPGIDAAFNKMTSLDKVNMGASFGGTWKHGGSIGGYAKGGIGTTHVTVHPGAVQLNVSGNVDHATLPKVQKMLDDTVEELTRMLK